MDLSVVIVNWNTRDLLRNCLASLRRATAELASGDPAVRTEIIVVDNASRDGSAAMVGQEFPEVRLIANEENRNYAAGTNQALKRAEGRRILLLNPDTEVPPEAPGSLIALLEQHPDVAAVAPALVGPAGRRQDSVRRFPTPARLLAELTGLSRVFPGASFADYRRPRLDPELPTVVDQPMASCLLLRSETVRQLGGMDERFPLFFNDVDLCYRLRESGWRILYDPRVRVLHHCGASTRQVRPAAAWQSHLGLVRFYRKHFAARYGRLACSLMCGAILAAGVVRTAWVWATGPFRRRA